MNEPNTSAREKSKPSQWIELGPLLIFFVFYYWMRRTSENPDTVIYPAAGLLAVLSVFAVGYAWMKHKKIPGILVFSTSLVVFFAGLAYFLKDPRFFYIKPTIVNIAFGLAVIGGVFMKKNVIKLMFGDLFELPIKAWNKLAFRWGYFFFACAALNELVWRTQSEPFWVNFKLFGLMPLTILFTISQFPFIMKNGTVKGMEEDES